MVVQSSVRGHIYPHVVRTGIHSGPIHRDIKHSEANSSINSNFMLQDMFRLYSVTQPSSIPCVYINFRRPGHDPLRIVC